MAAPLSPLAQMVDTKRAVRAREALDAQRAVEAKCSAAQQRPRKLRHKGQMLRTFRHARTCVDCSPANLPPPLRVAQEYRPHAKGWQGDGASPARGERIWRVGSTLTSGAVATQQSAFAKSTGLSSADVGVVSTGGAANFFGHGREAGACTGPVGPSALRSLAARRSEAFALYNAASINFPVSCSKWQKLHIDPCGQPAEENATAHGLHFPVSWFLKRHCRLAAPKSEARAPHFASSAGDFPVKREPPQTVSMLLLLHRHRQGIAQPGFATSTGIRAAVVPRRHVNNCVYTKVPILHMQCGWPAQAARYAVGARGPSLLLTCRWPSKCLCFESGLSVAMPHRSGKTFMFQVVHGRSKPM